MIRNKKILVFVAHPDDETTCSGTIAKLTKAGNEVVQVVATNGDKGTHDRKVTPEDITKTRKGEMKKTAELLGISKVIWLGFSDGTLEANLQKVKEQTFKTVRQEKPDVVITFDPWKRWDVHSDHRTIGFTSAEAAYLADSHWYYPEHFDEGLETHDVKETYLFHSDEPNYSVDVRETFDLKKSAADEHKSQSLQFETFGDKYLSMMNKRIKNEEDLYKEFFRKLNQTDLKL